MRLEAGTRTLPFGTIELTLDESGLSWGGYRLEQFVSTTTLEVRGLRNRYSIPVLVHRWRRALAGATSAKVVGSERLGPFIKVPVTALVRIDDARASLATGRVRPVWRFTRRPRFDRYGGRAAATARGRPTAGSVTSSTGSPLYALEIAAFFRAGAPAQLLRRDWTQDGRFMLQPYTAARSRWCWCTARCRAPCAGPSW